MIVGESQIHHGTDLDLISDRDRALLNRVHAEDGGLGRIQNRGGENRAIDATIRYGEDAAEQVGEGEFSFSGSGGDGCEGFFHSCEVELIAIPKNGNHQTSVGPHRHTDIEIVLRNDFVPFDSGV